VPPERLLRWFDNFAARHGAVEFALDGASLRAVAADDTLAFASLPFERSYDGPPVVSAFTAAASVDLSWGVLLVRKGGFAVATVSGAKVVSSKVGQRHVQGRTKAGGQSQQRFARRRDNQARQAYEAAAEHAHRILVLEGRHVRALVCGGDRQAVEAVLASARLAHLVDVRTGPWLAVPDPRRSVLDKAVLDGRSATVRITQP
jgi:Actinobacteria/chloroflexi VLRF1 release factor